MKERPILFSAPLVRAILEGRKTQTRRVVKLPHENPLGTWEPTMFSGTDARGVEHPEQPAIWHTRTGDTLACPFGQPGDRLWVRETWAADLGCNMVQYAANNDSILRRTDDGWKHVSVRGLPYVDPPRWRPSIHMPRWVCRLELEVTDVRVERLQDIGEGDAIVEGCPGGHSAIPGYGYNATAREHFQHIWETINGSDSWASNPFVWAITFKRVGGVNG